MLDMGESMLGYLNSHAKTRIDQRERQVCISKPQREERKSTQFAEAENVIEHFLENRMDIAVGNRVAQSPRTDPDVRVNASGFYLGC